MDRTADLCRSSLAALRQITFRRLSTLVPLGLVERPGEPPVEDSVQHRDGSAGVRHKLDRVDHRLPDGLERARRP